MTDVEIDKKWVYLEGNTLSREFGPFEKARSLEIRCGQFLWAG